MHPREAAPRLAQTVAGNPWAAAGWPGIEETWTWQISARGRGQTPVVAAPAAPTGPAPGRRQAVAQPPVGLGGGDQLEAEDAASGGGHRGDRLRGGAGAGGKQLPVPGAYDRDAGAGQEAPDHDPGPVARRAVGEGD